MMFKTHIVFSLFVGLLFIKFHNVNNLFFFFLTVLFFGIFPDIDEKTSNISRNTRVVSWIVNLLFRHRGIFHSIFIPLSFFFVFLFLGEDTAAFAVILGYMSHLFIDMLNKGGIRLFYPLSRLKIHFFFKTGKLFDYFLFFAFLFLDIFMIISILH